MLAVLRNNGVELRHTFYVDGQPHDADGNLVTVGITKANGSTLVAAGTATVHGTTGEYKFVLPPQAKLDLPTATWTGTFSGVVDSQADQLEIVGGVYCTQAELQALPNIPATVTADDLLELRRDFEDLAERYIGVAMVPRYAADRLEGRGRTHVQLTNRLPRTVLAVTVNGAAATDLSGYGLSAHGRLDNLVSGFARPSIAGANVLIEYEHGRDAPPPALRRCCKLYVALHARLGASALSGDVLFETDAAGITTRYSTPDWDAGRPTGLLHVDNVLNGLRRTQGR